LRYFSRKTKAANWNGQVVITVNPNATMTVKMAETFTGRVGAAHRNKPVHIFVAGAQVRIVTEEGQMLRALTIDPTRDYHPLNGRWPVHNLLRRASTMS
jgi:hypothetical protein